jgi:hypothetical protein
VQGFLRVGCEFVAQCVKGQRYTLFHWGSLIAQPSVCK